MIDKCHAFLPTEDSSKKEQAETNVSKDVHTLKHHIFPSRITLTLRIVYNDRSNVVHNASGRDLYSQFFQNDLNTD